MALGFPIFRYLSNPYGTRGDDGMTMKNFCDHCEKEMSSRVSRPRLRVEGVSFNGAPYFVFEFCDTCMVECSKLLSEFTGAPILKGQAT